MDVRETRETSAHMRDVDTTTISVFNLTEFYRSQIILHPSLEQCLYLNYLPHNIVYSCWDWFFNRWGLRFIGSLGCILLVCGRIYGLLFGSDGIYVSLMGCGNGLAIIASLFVLPFANYDIFKMLTGTFDFWYKLYNLISILFAAVWLKIIHGDWTSPVYHYLMGWFAIFCGFFVVFCEDSLPANRKIVQIWRSIIGFLAIIEPIRVYLFVEDGYWNMFAAYDFEYTQISLKGVYLSSYVNLSLFVNKPILRFIGRKIARMICSCCNNNNPSNGNQKEDNQDHIADDFFRRSASLFKRPHIQWNVDEPQADR